MKAVFAILASGLALTPAALAQNGLFDIGNLVVSQVGDGTAALSNAATVCSVREISTLGVFTGDNAPMPTVVSGLQRRLTVSGTATSEGFLTLSPNGNQLSFQGYDAAPGTATVSSTTSAAVNRVVAAVNLSMNVDTGTALTDAHSANSIRSSLIIGPTVYTGGAGNGVRSAPFGFVGTSTAESANLANTRVINQFAGALYASSSSGTFVGISTIAAGAATLLINTAGTGTGTASPYDFVFANATTCYIADDRTVANGGGVQKWTFASGTWSLAYTLNSGLTAGLRSLTMDPASGTLYAISADTATKLVAVVDTGAPSAFSTLYQSTTNTNLRGVEFISVPTPGSAALLAFGGVVAIRRRRR